MPRTGQPVFDPSEISLDFLCSLVPNFFSGERNQIDAFISDCDNAFELSSEENKYPLFRFIYSRITGKARIRISMYHFDNWDDVKTKLIELYQDKKPHSQLMEELTSCRQKSNESVTEFYERLENLSRGIVSNLKVDVKDKRTLSIKIDYINEIALGRFIYHSNSEISQVLRWRNFDSINSAYSAAIAEEKFLEMRRGDRCCNCDSRNSNASKLLSPVQIPKFCKYCKKSGHLLDECFRRKKNNELREKQSKASVNLNLHQSPVVDTALEESVGQLKVSEI
mgnify:CR=1 FL=1